MIYGVGAAMGLGPRQVDELTPWEFAVAAAGWRRANSAETDVRAPTPEEHDALMAKHG